MTTLSPGDFVFHYLPGWKTVCVDGCTATCYQKEKPQSCPKRLTQLDLEGKIIGSWICGEELITRFCCGRRRFRGTVADTLSLRSVGEELMIPVVKRSGKIVHWMKRSEVRKVPSRRNGGLV